jgi:hypothetical protein
MKIVKRKVWFGMKDMKKLSFTLHLSSLNVTGINFGLFLEITGM